MLGFAMQKTESKMPKPGPVASAWQKDLAFKVSLGYIIRPPISDKIKSEMPAPRFKTVRTLKWLGLWVVLSLSAWIEHSLTPRWGFRTVHKNYNTVRCSTINKKSCALPLFLEKCSEVQTEDGRLFSEKPADFHLNCFPLGDRRIQGSCPHPMT